MKPLYSDIQKLEPGARIELFELDMQPVIGAGSANILWFHGYTQVGPIYWQGNEYSPWPIQAEGFELNPQKPPQPTFSAGNVDGSITALCLAYQDLVGAKLIRHRTLGKYLDVANFGGTNPDADPTQEFPPDIWYIEQKLSETPEVVQFALSSAMDFGQVQLPRRRILAKDFPAAGLTR